MGVLTFKPNLILDERSSFIYLLRGLFSLSPFFGVLREKRHGQSFCWVRLIEYYYYTYWCLGSHFSIKKSDDEMKLINTFRSQEEGAWGTVICVSAVSLNYMPHHLPTYNLQMGCKFARKKIMEEKEIHWFDPMSMCYKVIITVNLLPKAKVRKRSTEREWMCGWILKSCTCGCWLAWEESGGEWKKNEPTCWSIDGT